MKRLKIFVKNQMPFLVAFVILKEFSQEYFRYIRFSGISLRDGNDSFLGKIIAIYHVIEKGLTMPAPKLGFGRDQVIRLSKLLITKSRVSSVVNHPQFHHAVGVLLEYRNFHERQGFQLDETLLNAISDVSALHETTPARQGVIDAEVYFQHADFAFGEFSLSRKSVRCFGDSKVEKETIRRAVEIAQSTPSSCNRQTSRVHAFYDKKQIEKLLHLQAGSRGWGDKATCLLVVTGDISLCHNVYEQDLVKVDGGMYAMSLIYALHHLQIACCPLNCYMPKKRATRIREIAGIPRNQDLVVMIACGHPSPKMNVAISPRRNTSEVLFNH